VRQHGTCDGPYNPSLMRLLVTADLHFNHPRSRPLAVALIAKMNATGGDVLLLVGDTAVLAGDDLEVCLSSFNFDGPKLFVAGNHELWTGGNDSYEIFTTALPARVRALGWLFASLGRSSRVYAVRRRYASQLDRASYRLFNARAASSASRR